MRIRKYKVDPNLLIASGVLVASFSALFVYIQQAAIMREQTELLLEQTKANAWPHLTISMSISAIEDKITQHRILISNRGTGPAIIEGVIVTYQGKSVQNWEQFYKLINVPDSIFINHSYHNIYGYIVRPGEDFQLIDWSIGKELMQYVYKRANDITIRICYRSVYNDFWQVKREGFYTDLEQNERQEIEQCTFGGDSVFLQ